MRASVTAAWPTVAREHEGVLPWMYLDTVGKVTVGIGTLLDSGTDTAPETCLVLPWTTQARPATRAEIASAWQRVKARTDLASSGGGAFQTVTTLRLDARTVDKLLLGRTAAFWLALVEQLPALEAWPADAQLALIDMAYQLGPRFMGPKWPNFTAAARAADFAGCAAHCSVKQANAERNGHRIRLFTNAAKVAQLGIDPAILWDTKEPEETMATERLTPPYPVGSGRTCIDVIKALPLVEYRFLKAGWIREDFSGLISQWSYQNNAVSASSTTHNGGGVFDVDFSLVNTDAKLVVWQECGFAPFRRRKPQWSLAVHGHICVIGCDHLDAMAARQVTDYHNGRNGLASHAAYDGPIKADRTWRRAQEIYATLIDEEIDMPSLSEIRAVISEELAQAVRDRELINNRGFEPGTAGGEPNRYLTLNSALISIRGKQNEALGGDNIDDIAKAVEALEAGEEKAIDARLTRLEGKLDAILAALPKPPPA